MNVVLVEPRSILRVDVLHSANLHSPRALTGIRSWREDDCQTLHALSRMNDNRTDISGTGWTRHQNAVGPQFEVRVLICIMDIRDDLLRVKQYHEIMRQVGDRVHLQFDVGEQYRTGFGNTHRRPPYADVDCARLRPMVEACS